MRRLQSTILLLVALSIAPLTMSIGLTPKSELGFIGASGTSKIVFDYSHDQSNPLSEAADAYLAANLTELGYEVIWTKGGINSSILSDATGLILGAMNASDTGYTTDELNAISTWFNSGSNFMWVGYGSEMFGQFVNDNMTAILESVGSHVYGEPALLTDSLDHVNQEYEVIVEDTERDLYVRPTILGVSDVLIYSGTALYGSDSITPGENVSAFRLTDRWIDNLYPLLYTDNSYLKDYDEYPTYAYEAFDYEDMAVATLEIHAGVANDGILVVSGGTPYGGPGPMASFEYSSVEFDGYAFVAQTIDFGMQVAAELPPTNKNTEGFYWGINLGDRFDYRYYTMSETLDYEINETAYAIVTYRETLPEEVTYNEWVEEEWYWTNGTPYTHGSIYFDVFPIGNWAKINSDFAMGGLIYDDYTLINNPYYWGMNFSLDTEESSSRWVDIYDKSDGAIAYHYSLSIDKVSGQIDSETELVRADYTTELPTETGTTTETVTVTGTGSTSSTTNGVPFDPTVILIIGGVGAIVVVVVIIVFMRKH